MYYLCSNPETRLDPMYRYQVSMPVFRSCPRKGRIITVFDNCAAFSRSVGMDPELLIKLLGILLSCQSVYTVDESFIKGRYTAEQFQHAMNTIIYTYILCKQCDCPEVVMDVKKTAVRHKCSACGAKYYVADDGSKVYDAVRKHLIVK